MSNPKDPKITHILRRFWSKIVVTQHLAVKSDRNSQDLMGLINYVAKVLIFMRHCKDMPVVHQEISTPLGSIY